jgi:CRISPR/Cas system-associated endoribonuclease Cas2
MSSPESAILLPRDTDFGYEVIPSESKEDTSSASVADHYKGTPPPKAKKKRASHSSRQQQQSKEVHSSVYECKMQSNKFTTFYSFRLTLRRIFPKTIYCLRRYPLKKATVKESRL